MTIGNEVVTHILSELSLTQRDILLSERTIPLRKSTLPRMIPLTTSTMPLTKSPTVDSVYSTVDMYKIFDSAYNYVNQGKSGIVVV